jgi:hypothetical protein
MKIVFAILIAVVVFLGLNYRQLYTVWTIKSETKRLLNTAVEAPVDFKNPALLEDDFSSKLSPDFWKFFIINGAGKVSHENVWHSAEIEIRRGLSINHFPDPEFENKNQFVKPFDMFGFSVAGRESSIMGVNGPLC